jgi:hypothetical protein
VYPFALLLSVDCVGGVALCDGVSGGLCLCGVVVVLKEQSGEQNRA